MEFKDQSAKAWWLLWESNVEEKKVKYNTHALDSGEEMNHWVSEGGGSSC